MKNYQNDAENEIPVYKKRKESSVSHSKNKSKHKHVYMKSLFYVKGCSFIYLGEYCSICGKIGRLELPVEKDSLGYYTMLTDAQIHEKYKTYEEFELEDFTQKYIPIGEKVEVRKSEILYCRLSFLS